MYCMLYVCFALHCLHEYPSNVSSSFTVITKHKYLYFGLQRTFSINNHSRRCNIISSHYSDFKFIKYTKIKSTHNSGLLLWYQTCTDYWLELQLNVNTFLLKTSCEHFHFGLEHVIDIQEKNTKEHHIVYKINAFI